MTQTGPVSWRGVTRRDSVTVTIQGGLSSVVTHPVSWASSHNACFASSLAGPQTLDHIANIQYLKGQLRYIYMCKRINGDKVIIFVFLYYQFPCLLSTRWFLSQSQPSLELWHFRALSQKADCGICGEGVTGPRSLITVTPRYLLSAHSLISELSTADQSQSGKFILCKNISRMREFSPAWHNQLVTNVIWVRIWQVWQCWMSRHVL